LVSIHCFANGNGRHSRLLADIVIGKIFKLPVFTWGAGDSIKHEDQREAYLLAIKAADAGNLKPLIDFARS
jgi:fido (protein-threonine AMPylation protein)